MELQIRRQISVSLVNQPGALSRATEVLARKGVNILGISILDTVAEGTVRLHVSDPATARSALEAEGLRVIEAELFEIDLVDTPGRLARVCAALAAGGVNIEYAYGTVGDGGGRMHLLLKASPPARVADILQTLPED